MKIFFTSYIILFIFCTHLCAQKNIVFLVGERYNSTSQTMPSLAVALEETHKHKTYYINIPKNGSAENINIIEKADLLICYLHLRNLPNEQIKLINRHLEAGKAVIAFKSTSQAFEKQPEWFAKYFGGGFRGYVKEKGQSTVSVIPAQLQHPVCRGLESATFHTSTATAIPGPLHKNATPLLMGKSGDSPSFPVAWTYKTKGNEKVFYTSLGSADDFKNKNFLKIIDNAVQWCLSNETVKVLPELAYPDPPKINLPQNAEVLFDGSHLNQWRHWDLLQKPQSLDIEEHFQEFSNVNVSPKVYWKVKRNALITEIGKGDLITKKHYGDYLLSLDFLIPEEPEYVDKSMRGSGGIFISGRYEIRINAGKESSKTGPNSIYSFRAPDHEVELKPGVWHNMRIRYKHLNKGPAVISAVINGTTVHGDIKLKKPTPYGILEPISRENPDDLSLHTVSLQKTAEKIHMGENDFTVAARFKTSSKSGTVFSRTSEASGWERDGKAFFIGDGEIYYDIGWRGIIKTSRRVNDGKWHHAILTNTKDMCTMYVDGEVAFMKKKFSWPDPADQVFKIGYEFKNFYRPFNGEISNVRYYKRALSYKEVMQLSEQNSSPEDAVLDWKDSAENKISVRDADDNTVLKGPLRLHGDFSRIRYANIWIKEF